MQFTTRRHREASLSGSHRHAVGRRRQPTGLTVFPNCFPTASQNEAEMKFTKTSVAGVESPPGKADHIELDASLPSSTAKPQLRTPVRSYPRSLPGRSRKTWASITIRCGVHDQSVARRKATRARPKARGNSCDLANPARHRLRHGSCGSCSTPPIAVSRSEALNLVRHQL
jgi:hypothetical protein